MNMLGNIVNHWATINIYDMFVVFYIFLHFLVVITSNNIFASFVAAKPDWRKTAVGR